MADSESVKADASAEKAYAEASESIAPVKGAPVSGPAAAPVEPVVEAMAIPLVKPKAARKSAKPAAQPVAAKAAKPAVRKPRAAAPVTAPATKPSSIPTNTASAKIKDKTMTIKTKITEGFDSVIGDAQAKAKEAFEKSTAVLGDYAEFTKGNVEAVVESGKILAEGLQDMGTNLVAEGRSTFETVSADIKSMAAAKSPTDLIQLQSEMFRKSFDSAVAYGSKNTEAMLKIASDAIAPISSRVSLAVEKVRQSAI